MPIVIEAGAWQTFSRADVELAYADVGDGPDAIVLLHGLAGTAEEWSGTMRALRGSHRLVALDQRGHGRSTRRPREVTRDAYVGDVVALLERVGAPVTLVGQSMGGHTAMLVAAENPGLVRKLVMVEAGVGGAQDDALDGLSRWLHGWPVPFADRDEFADFFDGTPSAAQAWADGLEIGPGGLLPRWDADVLVEAIRPVLVMPRWRAWEKVTAPTELVLAERSLLDAAQVERMVATRPGIRVRTIAGAGHDLHLDQPLEWIAALREVVAT
ncbi:alpha/beta fold hydrolase [Flexivirga meconopsidis]|uniref:alpha/beta fold hydrolase n=1 Tax=Flexivirga meconopsidis TaxID=2977121 RepID=UPI00223F9F3E|nr:alpha/beta hydrolase [Flexivirga meconopsidis]